ncbi:hypothetical protein D3C80_928550 [compost metagenome]
MNDNAVPFAVATEEHTFGTTGNRLLALALVHGGDEIAHHEGVHEADEEAAIFALADAGRRDARTSRECNALHQRHRFLGELAGGCRHVGKGGGMVRGDVVGQRIAIQHAVLVVGVPDVLIGRRSFRVSNIEVLTHVLQAVDDFELDVFVSPRFQGAFRRFAQIDRSKVNIQLMERNALLAKIPVHLVAVFAKLVFMATQRLTTLDRTFLQVGDELEGDAVALLGSKVFLHHDRIGGAGPGVSRERVRLIEFDTELIIPDCGDQTFSSTGFCHCSLPSDLKRQRFMMSVSERGPPYSGPPLGPPEGAPEKSVGSGAACVAGCWVWVWGCCWAACIS